MSKIKIGFLGFGNMAKAIVKGLNDSNHAYSIIFNKKNKTNVEQLENDYAITFVDKVGLILESDILILALKPQQFATFNRKDSLKKFKHTVISIMAGIPTHQLQEIFVNAKSIIRTMPNTSAVIKKSSTLFCCSQDTSKQDIEICHKIFSSIGTITKIDENLMNIGTGLFGSFPAIIYKIADDLIQISEENKISKKDSETLIKMMFHGCGEMLTTSKKSPTELIQEIKSPNGTTEAALKQYERINLKSNLNDLIKAAENRSKELSN